MKRLLDDNKVIMTWGCPLCNEECEVNPTFYQDNGTPMCTDCDEDMEYLHTTLDED